MNSVGVDYRKKYSEVIALNVWGRGRGRDVSYLAPPAQIRT